MTGKTHKPPAPGRAAGTTETRAERLKAALRANLQKRKAQARSKASGQGGPAGTKG